MPTTGHVGRHRVEFPLFVLTVLALTNLIVGTYLVLVEPRELALAPAWAGALSLMPNGDPAPFGGGLILATAVLPFAFDHRLHLGAAGWFGLIVGAASWGALAGSFVYAAVTTAGVGTMSAAAAAAFCALHLGVLFLKGR